MTSTACWRRPRALTAAAWKALFDGICASVRRGRVSGSWRSILVADSDEYVDGKPRYDRSPGDAPAEQQAGRAVITEGYSL